MDPLQNPRPALNNLVALFGPTIPGIYRSLRRYLATCSLTGCSLPSRAGSGYCCLGHQDLAASNEQIVQSSFHYVGGFLNPEDKQLRCCISLINRCRQFRVGIPVLDAVPIFDSFPWEQPDIFSTEMGTTDWLFFKKPPSEYKQIRKTRMKWKLMARKQLKLSGIEHHHIYMTGVSLCRQRGEVVEECDINMAREWCLTLFQCLEFSLYCMSSKSEAEAEPEVTRINRPSKPATDSLKSANNKRRLGETTLDSKKDQDKNLPPQSSLVM